MIVVGMETWMIGKPSFILFFMADVVFTWNSNEQPILTYETKFVSTTLCVCHAIWLKNLLDGLNLPQEETTEIYVNKKS